MKLEIKKAKLSDLKEIDLIYKEGVIKEVKLQYPKKTEKEILNELNKYKEERLKGFKENIKSKFSYLIVVLLGREIVGFGEAVINKDNKKNAEVTKIYIKKDLMGKGIGSFIMKDILKWLGYKNVKSISAGIFIKNIPSIKLNKKFGFETTAIRMVKKLK